MKYLMSSLLIAVLLLMTSGCAKLELTPPPKETAPPVQQTKKTTQPPITPVASEEPIPSSNPDLKMTADQVEEMVINVVEAAAEYIEKYSNQTQFVSKNGYLAESAGDIYVRPDDLQEVTKLKPEYSNESVLILYVARDDVKEYIDTGEGLMPVAFAAYETVDGYMLAGTSDTGQSKSGTMKKEQLVKLLSKYSWDHGSITRLSKDSAGYAEIVKVLTDISDEADLDVRYLTGDEKYASAVVSPKDSPLHITEYVLENKNGSWAVAVPSIEQIDWKFTSINKALPDMNLTIVPRYQLVDTMKFLNNDFNPIINAMRKEDLIGDSDGEPEYISGDNEFVYMVFSTGKKYLGHYDDEIMTWVMYPVEDYSQAMTLMKQYAKFTHPSYFLIRQD